MDPTDPTDPTDASVTEEDYIRGYIQKKEESTSSKYYCYHQLAVVSNPNIILVSYPNVCCIIIIL